MDHKLTYSIPLSRLPAEMTVATISSINDWIDRSIEIWGGVQIIDAVRKQAAQRGYDEIKPLLFRAIDACDDAFPGNAGSVAALTAATDALASEWARIRDAE